MLNISIDIITIGEFKKQMARWLKTTKNTGRPLITTQNGKRAAVVMSTEEFDNLQYIERFM
ncbi:type II toxin-antitoxin system Phd/YefM family antitoxin [Caldithrix abyssi]